MISSNRVARFRAGTLVPFRRCEGSLTGDVQGSAAKITKFDRLHLTDSLNTSAEIGIANGYSRFLPSASIHGLRSLGSRTRPIAKYTEDPARFCSGIASFDFRTPREQKRNNFLRCRPNVIATWIAKATHHSERSTERSPSDRVQGRISSASAAGYPVAKAPGQQQTWESNHGPDRGTK